MEERELVFEYDEAESSRLDHFLVSNLPELSRSRIQALIKAGEVQVDGETITKTGYKVEAPCTVKILIPPPEPSEIIPEDIPLDIIYENKDVAVINKPPGLVVHPAAGHQTGTLVHALLAHIPDLEGVGGVKRPGIVHRLDKNTSGLLIVAKNDRAHRELQRQFKERSVEKHYLTLVDGQPPTKIGRIEAAIGRDPANRKRMAVTTENKGRAAISEYQTKEQFDKHAFLDVHILTGRTHQIRVHMAFIGCPVVGDTVYGRKRPTLPVKRQLLHAARMQLQLPGAARPRLFEAPLPDDFLQTLARLRA
ncbi:MAG: RluA family pseudouridine synthase [Anaerolineales bacterium]|nr:RluA family pseudouridine synthase [Anaerolineales bacterium]